MTLSDLTTEDLAMLGNRVAHRFQVPLGGKGKVRTENGCNYLSGYFIKYLDPRTHFPGTPLPIRTFVNHLRGPLNPFTTSLC